MGGGARERRGRVVLDLRVLYSLGAGRASKVQLCLKAVCRLPKGHSCMSKWRESIGLWEVVMEKSQIMPTPC